MDKVLAAGGGKLVIADKEVISRVVEGEEEAQFWKEANEKRAVERTKKGDRFGGNNRRGGGGGRGKRNNRRGGQKRKNNRDDNDDDDSNDGDEQSAKKVKATTDD